MSSGRASKDGNTPSSSEEGSSQTQLSQTELGASSAPTPSGADDFSRVVANITHELKTPLHSILAIAGVLATEVDGPLTEEQRRQVEMIVRNGERLLEQIVDLLQFSSVRTETRRTRLRRVAVRKLFEGLVSVLLPVAAKAGITLDADFSRLDAQMVTDEALLNRIFGNLLSNAVKFSPDGGLVSFHAESHSDGSLSAYVADSGIGMSPEQQSAIFKEFYQADAGDSRRFGGVGLGLALVRTSVERLGGKLELTSEPGKGSLFTVTLPSREGSVKPPRILILDDDPTVRFTLEACFIHEGYEPCVIERGDDLHRRIAELQPDLVMLDVKAPELRSLELLAEIRNSSWGAELPVILISALDGPKERSRGFELGASDFILKPFDVTELLARVRSQLERSW